VRWHLLSHKYGATNCKIKAPILEGAAIFNWEGVECPNWPILIDTGSDRTIIPTTAPAFLGTSIITTDPKYSVSIISGDAVEVYPLVYVRIFHKDFGFLPVRAACAAQGHILLGRDVLSQLLLIYDGKLSRFLIRPRRKLDRAVLGCLRRMF